MTDDDPRVLIPVRLRASSVARVDKIAVANDWSRSAALRTLLAYGLDVWDEKHPPAQAKAPKR